MYWHYTPNDVTRFWLKVDKSPHPKGCWLWTACLARGYGQFSLNTRSVKAHRFSYLLAHGECPRELLVCHTCDNPICVNPEHLFLGTLQDNVRDSVAKKRHTHGEIHGARKLSLEDVHEIRRIWELGGITQQTIATRYKVSQTHISAIILENKWKG